MRSLLLLRHARTEDTRPGQRDLARRLTPDGQQQAAALGDHLRAQHLSLDLVMCSPAARARQTVEAMRTTAPVVIGDGLYTAGSDEIIALVREFPADLAHVLVVAHSPGLPAVVHEVADPRISDPEAMATLRSRFPAGALATLTVTGAWSDLDRAALVSLRLP